MTEPVLYAVTESGGRYDARDAWLKERNLTYQDTRVERVYYSIDVLPML